jgi:hypothetical protein
MHTGAPYLCALLPSLPFGFKQIDDTYILVDQLRRDGEARKEKHGNEAPEVHI